MGINIWVFFCLRRAQEAKKLEKRLKKAIFEGQIGLQTNEYERKELLN